MDKTARLQYAMGIPSLEEEDGDDAAFHALLNGVMIAMQAEIARADEGPAADTASEAGNTQTAVQNGLEPEQVVRIQLAALKVNDVPRAGHGIAMALTYCTPQTRDYLEGMVPFACLFKSAKYAPLLNFQKVEFEPVQIDGDQASQRFRILAADGTKHRYIAQLVRQHDGPDADLWLTDALINVAD